MLATVWGATLVVATMLAGWVFLGALLPIAYGVQVVPSIWSAYRTWAPSGVAVATWMTILVECVLWGVYGLARQDPALTTLSVIGSAAALAIVVRVLWTRDRFSHDGAQLGRRIEREAPSRSALAASSSPAFSAITARKRRRAGLGNRSVAPISHRCPAHAGPRAGLAGERRGRATGGDQAFELVAGAGFEPATFGL